MGLLPNMPTIKVANEYLLPESMFATCRKGESIIYFGRLSKNNTMQVCFGFGQVIDIQIGNNFDLITMNFGLHYNRQIIVKWNDARKQILTLKKGEYAQFFGFRKDYYRTKKKDEKFQRADVYFFAKQLQGWYVPKTMNRKSYDPKEVEKLTQENESKIDFIEKLVREELDNGTYNFTNNKKK